MNDVSDGAWALCPECGTVQERLIETVLALDKLRLDLQDNTCFDNDREDYRAYRATDLIKAVLTNCGPSAG